MSRIEYETDINAPVERVYEYYTDPDNIKEAWPRDVVKESEARTNRLYCLIHFFYIGI